MNDKIFRKSALDRLSSPEQLDMTITVMKPRAWLILAGLIVIILAVGIWGVVGKIESTVSAVGMITSSGGSEEVIHSYAGMVTDIGVEPGRTVKRGDVVARISQTDLVKQISDLQYDLNVLNSIGPGFNPLTIIFAPNSDSVTALYEQACLSKSGQFETARRLEIAKCQSKIGEAQETLRSGSEIIAPVDGIVSNIYISKDTAIQAGQSVMSIMEFDPLTNQLQAILYENYQKIQGITTGDTVKIIPAGVASSSGFLMGTVVSVNSAPSTQEAMQKALGNADVVSAIVKSSSANSGSTGNSYVEIRVALDVDTTNSTGYKWSVKNPPISSVAAGSICNAYIVTGETSPIGLLLG